MTPDLFDTGLGDLDSTYSISADGFEAASSTCSASSGGLGRRELSVCPDKRPDLEYELRFDKTGERFLFMTGNPAICRMFEMCPGCLYAVCDSGVDADRIPTLVPAVYDLNNASPCNGWSHLSDIRFLIFWAVDLAKGCFSPHDIWCCGNPFFGDYQDHHLLSYVSWLMTLVLNSDQEFFQPEYERFSNDVSRAFVRSYDDILDHSLNLITYHLEGSAGRRTLHFGPCRLFLRLRSPASPLLNTKSMAPDKNLRIPLRPSVEWESCMARWRFFTSVRIPFAANHRWLWSLSNLDRQSVGGFK